MYLKAPKSSINNIGIGGITVNVVNGVGDFTGVPADQIAVLYRRGWKTTNGPGDPNAVGVDLSAKEVAAVESAKTSTSPLVQQQASVLALLIEFDALDDEKIKERINILEDGITLPTDANHDRLVQILTELTLERRRKDAAILADQAALEGAAKPPGSAEGEGSTGPTGSTGATGETAPARPRRNAPRGGRDVSEE